MWIAIIIAVAILGAMTGAKRREDSEVQKEILEELKKNNETKTNTNNGNI